jgi:hypothetical protein
MGTVVLAWVGVALSFAVTFAAGVALEEHLEVKDQRNKRFVPVFYICLPLGTALLVAFILRARL